MGKREEERKAKRLKRVELFIKIQKIFTEKKNTILCIVTLQLNRTSEKMTSLVSKYEIGHLLGDLLIYTYNERF